MPFGILNDPYLEHVPGTAALVDINGKARRAGLKHGEGSNSKIILVPQPSNDPLDPLNWPRWRKEGVFWTLAFGAGLAGAIGHLLNPGFVELSKEWGVSVDTVAATNNTLILTLGCFMLIQAPLAIKFGRRPVYLLGATLFFTCSIWSAVSKGLDSFTGSRALQGFGMAPFEALVTATIADIFFVHQRGLRTAIWSFAILAGINIAPIVNGSVIQSSRLGWRFCFWFITAMFGILLLGIVFLVPETVYDRDSKFDTDLNGKTAEEVIAEKSNDDGADKSIEGQGGGSKGSLKEKEVEVEEYPVNIESSRRYRSSWMRIYLPWSGYVAKESMLAVFLRPFRFLASPIILYGIAVYGFTVIWLDVVNVIVATVFSLPPYHFNGSQVGLVSLGPFIGSIFAASISGPLSDWVTTEFAKRNNGIYEPESRLYLVIPMLILQVCGYLGWALMAPRGVHWIGPVLMYTLINVGLSIGNTGVVAYIIDVHRKNAPECFALINFIKDVILYGFIRFANSWVTNMGVLRTFGVLAGLSALCILTTIPMYIYGKRARSFVARHPRIFLV